MTIFLTGCTHFGHDRIISLCDRPFTCAGDMDEQLTHLWNKTVGKKDTVYHLGDFCMDWPSAARFKSALNGTIITLQGNHDPKGWGDDIVEFTYRKQLIVLCHYPIESWHWQGRGAAHFHAHTHSKMFHSGRNRGHVGVDACGFQPIALDDALERLELARLKL